MVAINLQEREDFKSYYLPKVVSMGPIHHGKAELQIGERYKLIWAKKYIGEAGDSKQVYKKITDNFAELRSYFADNVLAMASNTDLKGFGSFDEKLTWMLFVDGCSLLYIFDIFNDLGERMMKLVSRDVLLLENQLPFMLLHLLSSDKFHLIKRVNRFLDFIHVASTLMEEDYLSHIETTTHLLHLLGTMWFVSTFMREIRSRAQAIRAAYLFQRAASEDRVVPNVSINILKFFHLYQIRDCASALNSKRRSNSVVRYMNIQELKSNGIKIKSSNTCRLSEVHFSHGWLNGELTLPEIVLDDITVSMFLNLIAYEMCPDFENDHLISMFLAFINSLIRQPEDVKDLRSAGILFSNYGSDEELVKLFHFMATDVVSDESYSDLFEEINKHIANKWKTNTVRFLRYIRHPWTNFAIHATELALALTFIQTWFTIHPAKS